MKKLIFLCVVIVIVAACSSPKQITKTSSNPFNKKPDIASVKYEGGDGKSYETAIIINAKNEQDGVTSEYFYVSTLYGRRNIDWQFEGQSATSKNNKMYDILNISLTKNNQKIALYFDISGFYGKF